MGKRIRREFSGEGGERRTLQPVGKLPHRSDNALAMQIEKQRDRRCSDAESTIRRSERYAAR